MKKVCTLLINKKVFYAFVSLWIIAQVFLIWILWTPDWISDPGLYQYYATQCVNNGCLYPSYENYYDEFVFAPGWVNMLAVVYLITGSFRAVPYLLIIVNVLNLLFIMKICKFVTSNIYVYYALGYIYISIGVNLFSHIQPYSEYFFVLLTNIALYLSFKKKLLYYIVSGFLIALAIWVRPLAYSWIIAILYLGLFYHKSIKLCSFFIAGVFATCIIIGYSTHRNFPDFMFQASTGGGNMIMGADDTATGGYNPIPRQKGGRAYIPREYSEKDSIPVISAVTRRYEKLTSSDFSYKQSDSIYTAKSIEWIKENPLKWTLLFLPKLNILLFNGSLFFVPYKIGEYKVVGMVFNILNLWQLWLLRLCCFISLIGLFMGMGKKEIVLLIPVVLSIGMTIICVSATRYNYIFLFLLTLFSLISLGKIVNYVKRSNIHHCSKND